MTGAAERLRKLVPMLASDQPGEVLSTVAAIRRTLRSAGLDLNDLARVIDGKVSGENSAGQDHLRARIRELETALGKANRDIARLQRSRVRIS